MSCFFLSRACAHLLAFLPALYCLCSSPSLLAQSVESRALSPVSVVGTRFEQQLLDEPVQTSVVTADDILRSGAKTLVDVLALQTSIQFIDSSGSPNRQIDLRGFGMTGDQNTLILLDGQRITEDELASADLASIPLASVERIEILKGSGTVLYGRGATGGTINIITKKNYENPSKAMLSATVGDYGTRGVSASANLSHDRLALNVFADRNTTDNYRINNRAVQENITAALSYRGDRGPISLRLSSGEQSLRLPGARTNSQLLSDPRGATTPENYSNLESLRISMTTEQKFDWGFLGLDVAHRNREASSLFKDFGWISPDFTKVNVLSFSPRIRIPFEAGTVNHSFILGTDWDRWSRNRFPAEGEFGDYSHAQQDNSALYVRHTANFETGTSVAFGARSHRTETDWSVGSTAGSLVRNLNSYEIAIRQDLKDGWSLYAKSGTSFRLQTVDELLPYGVLNVLEPQISRDIDMGLRFSESKFTAGISFFQMKVKNEIALYPVVYPWGIFPANINLPPTQRRGLELDAKWQAAPAIRIAGTYTYTEAEFSNGSVDSDGVSVGGKKIPLVPTHKATVAVTWLASELTNLTLKGNYSGETRLDNDQKNTSNFRRPSFLVIDLAAFHEIDLWRLRASVLNLTDERYFTYGVTSAQYPNSSFNAYPAMRRSFLLTVERRF